MNDFAQINELVQQLSARAREDGWFEALCPFHDDRHPSLTFNNDGFICLSCGKRGTLDGLASALQFR